MANGIDPSASMAALFGSRVRRLRTAAGLTQADVGRKTHVVSTRITQIERASGAKPTLELARALDAALGADDLLVELWPYVYREAFPDWSRKFMEYSERAVAIREYAAHVVPGLLQTEDYARAVLSVGRSLGGEEQLEERVAAPHGTAGAARRARPARAVGGSRRGGAQASGRRPGGDAGAVGATARKPRRNPTSPCRCCRSTRASTTRWAAR